MNMGLYNINLRYVMLLMGVISVFFLPSCTSQMRFPTTKAEQASLEAHNIHIIPITTENVGKYKYAKWLRSRLSQPSNPPQDPSTYIYKVGVGDRLQVRTWSTPERTLAAGDLASEALVVNERGQFQYPFVGAIDAEGKTIEEIRATLSQRLKNYIADPQVEVAIETYGARSVTITGAVGSPGPQKITNIPLRLLDLINISGVSEDANIREVVIRREGKSYKVNVRAFIENGDQRQNPLLLPDDFIFVPKLENNKIFTFGEIGVGEIALNDGRLTLTEVLAKKGGISKQRADARGIFVFRKVKKNPDGYDVYQFNLEKAISLTLLAEFEMAPLDIVFVTNDPITQWNDTVGKFFSGFSGFFLARDVVTSFQN